MSKLPSEGVTVDGIRWCKRCPDWTCIGEKKILACDIRSICPKCGVDERTVTIASPCNCDDDGPVSASLLRKASTLLMVVCLLVVGCDAEHGKKLGGAL